MGKKVVVSIGKHDVAEGDRLRRVNSEYPILKRFQRKEFAVSVPDAANSGSTTIYHGLHYKPVVLPFINHFASGAVQSYFTRIPYSEESELSTLIGANMTINETTIVFNVVTGADTGPFTLKGFYYIFYQNIFPH